jgi:hypothetical protein
MLPLDTRFYSQHGSSYETSYECDCGDGWLGVREPGLPLIVRMSPQCVAYLTDDSLAFSDITALVFAYRILIDALHTPVTLSQIAQVGESYRFLCRLGTGDHVLHQSLPPAEC